jgi:hypothetical protein
MKRREFLKLVGASLLAPSLSVTDKTGGCGARKLDIRAKPPEKAAWITYLDFNYSYVAVNNRRSGFLSNVIA